VRLRGIEAFADAPPTGGIVEVRRFGRPDDPRPTLVLANRSDIDLDRHVMAPGATWLDYRLVERDRTPPAMSGVGQEVRNVMEARTEHLATDGLVRRQGPGIVPQRDYPRHAAAPRTRSRLRQVVQRDRDALLAARSRRAGCRQLPPPPHVELRPLRADRQRPGIRPPWTPTLDRHLGHHVAGVAKESGGIEWSFGRRRGLEI
jgi:hypothetical protein